MWRLGRAIERADMTTRVLGVRAAAVLLAAAEPATATEPDDHDEVQWMGVLRSVSGCRCTSARRGPIEGRRSCASCSTRRFPRSVRALPREIRRALAELPDPGGAARRRRPRRAVLRESTAAGTDGAALDEAMDDLQTPSPSSTGGSPSATCGVGTLIGVAGARRPGSIRGCVRRSPRGTPGSCRAARPRQLADAAGEADRLIAAAGAGHLVHDLPVRADGRVATVASRPVAARPDPARARRRRRSTAVAGRRRADARRWRRCSPTSTARARWSRDGIGAGRGAGVERRYRLAAVGAAAAAALADHVRRRRRRRRRRLVARRAGPRRHADRASGTRCSTAR